jgi:hypothetical protein
VKETLLFNTSQEMSAALEKIQAAFPTVQLLVEGRDGGSGFPACIDLGLVDEPTWCNWVIENGLFDACTTLVLLSMDPPGWMNLVFHAQQLKEEAKRLEGI